MLLKNKRFVCFALACTLLLLLIACSSPAAEEETPAVPGTTAVTEEVAEFEDAAGTGEAEGATDEEAGNTNAEEPAKKVQNKTSQTTQSGSFKHEVKKEINGVVEENQNEGWWKID